MSKEVTPPNAPDGPAQARDNLKRAEGHEGNAVPFARQLKERGDAMAKKHGVG